MNGDRLTITRPENDDVEAIARKACGELRDGHLGRGAQVPIRILARTRKIWPADARVADSDSNGILMVTVEADLEELAGLQCRYVARTVPPTGERARWQIQPAINGSCAGRDV